MTSDTPITYDQFGRMKYHPELAHNSIPVQLFTDMTLVDRQQAFADINSTAKTVSASLNSAYNHRDASAQHIASMIKMVECWNDQIEWEKSSCSGKNPKLFPLKAVIDATRLYLGKGVREEVTELEAYSAADFWKKVSIPAWWCSDHSCVDGRNSYITYHVVGLKALALWGREAINTGTDLDKAVSRLISHSDKFNRSASHWDGKCTDAEGRIKSNKDALIETVRYLCLITDILPSRGLGN